MQTAVTALAAYLLGSVSFAIIVSRLMRLPDPRSYGSGNPGATNVLRTGKKLAAVLALAGDAAKGWLAVVLAIVYVPEAAPLAGLAAFAGHLFPVFHRFQGGKGVATAAGVLLGLDPWLGLGSIATWVIIAAFFRYSSLAALISALFAPIFAWFIRLEISEIAAVTVIAALLVWRHADNISRLVTGQETRIGQKKASPPPDPNAA